MANDFRLYKVAKELNVTSERLVDYLHKSGHTGVRDDLNAKLNQTQYELLLKQFAPDRLEKIKAEEKKHLPQEPQDGGNNQVPPKLSLIPQKPKVLGKLDVEAIKQGKKVDLPQKEENLTEPPLSEQGETPVSHNASPQLKEQDGLVKTEEKIHTPILKREKLTGTSDKPKTESLIIPIEKRTIHKEVKKVEKTPNEAPLLPAAEDSPAVEQPVKKPLVIDIKPKEEKKEEKPLKTKKEQEVVAKKEKVTEELAVKDKNKISFLPPPPKTEEDALDILKIEPNEEEAEVIRAEAPQLTGLKILGKIELESPRRKKKEKEKDKKLRVGKVGTKIGDKEEEVEKSEKVSPDSKTANEDDSADKKKRKRKRKRKKTGEETTTASMVTGAINPDIKIVYPGQQDKKAKKEKVNEKDVQDTIKKTLVDMQKGAGRERQRLRRTKRDEAASRRQELADQEEKDAKILKITEFVTANELANLMDISVTEVVKKCFQLGMMVTINMRLDAEVIDLVAEEFGYEVEFVDVREEELEAEDSEEDKPEDWVKRNPVITVMGHVDHGKTTLLDFLRKAKVADSEAGGITQHIGAYQVKLNTGASATFLDTPGHEAFTAMRARGTKITDVAIIVIAADDVVMPTTREAISHAQAANVQMVFAINKIDKPGADPERIYTQLSEMNLLVDKWGGPYSSQEIAAKHGVNVDELLEKVMLEADVLDLKANPKLRANGTVIESRVDKGRGNVVTFLVQSGTLRVGDTLVAGIHYGKVRALLNQAGKPITEAGPSMPVQVLGMGGLPQAGDKFQVYKDESKAKEISRKRSELYREQQLRQTKRITLEEIARRKLLGNFKELNLIVKGDVDGSVEALSGSLLRLTSEEIAVNIILKGTGQISESDVLLASASDALIIAFNVRPGPKARELAEKEGVNIRTYSIIYDAINDVKDALEGMLSPEIREEITATVEVRQVFNITKVGNIAGCYVSSGKVAKTDHVRVVREGVVLADTKIQTLKRYKDDVKEVSGGYECGIQIQGFGDLTAGDTLECYRVIETKKKLS